MLLLRLRLRLPRQKMHLLPKRLRLLPSRLPRAMFYLMLKQLRLLL
jgi:hypothetical protein